MKNEKTIQDIEDLKEILINTNKNYGNFGEISQNIDYLASKLEKCKNFINLIEKNKEVVIEKWEKLGLLEGLNDEAKVIVSHAFEKIAKIILLEKLKSNEQVETICFPIIRVILSMNDNYNKFTVETVQDLMYDFLNTLIKSYEDDFNDVKIRCEKSNIEDYEAEFCHWFANKFSEENIK